MARKQVITLNDAPLNSDDGASANSIAVRDSSADLYAATLRSSAGLRSGGNFHRMVVNKTTGYTIGDTDDIVTGDTTSAGFTLTLPAAASSTGKIVTVVKTIAANTLTIQGAGSELINGSNTLALTTQYSCRTLVCNGTAWLVIAN